MDTNHSLIEKAKTYLILKQPFWGSLFLHFQLRESYEIPTICVNRDMVMTYNPNYLNSLTVKQIAGEYAHELGHVIYNHIDRRSTRDPHTWNEACDYAVDSLLKSEGFELTPLATTPPEYENLLAETIYNMLIKQENKKKESQGEGGGGGEGKGKGGGSSWENKTPSELQEQRGTDLHYSEEQIKKDMQSKSEGEIHSNFNEKERELHIKAIIASCAENARQAGSLSKNLQRILTTFIEPLVNWELLYRSQVRDNLRQDRYNFNRPNRRYMAHGIQIPSLEGEGYGDFVIGIDTSGSITNKELHIFGSETIGLMEDLKPSRVYVLYIDSTIKHIDVFEDVDEVFFQMHGGGGTRFSPLFKFLEENPDIQPSNIVYFTDLECNDFGKEPPFPVVWVTTSKNKDVPFGSIIHYEHRG